MTAIDAVTAALAGHLDVTAVPTTTGPAHSKDPVIVERVEQYARLVAEARRDPAVRESCLRQALAALQGIADRGQELSRQRQSGGTR